MLNFSFEQSFKLWWCSAKDLFGLQIPVTRVRFELQISCIRTSYLTHQALQPNRLGRFRVPKLATLGKEWLIHFEIRQPSFKI